MIKVNTVIIYLFLLVSCGKTSSNTVIDDNTIKAQSKIKNSLQTLNNSSGKNVMVIAHRGDWRNAPENSIQAIQNCIDMGVDMAEIDVRLTKDSIPVLMHDSSIDRTTTGQGKLREWTLDSLKTLYLKNGLGRKTHHRVPTLKEALILAKDKILINLDKCYDYFDVIYPILEQTATTNQIVMKGNVSSEKVKKDFEAYLDKIIFMPVIELDKSTAVKRTNEYLNNFRPIAFEFVFSDEKSPIISKFDSIQKLGSRIWVNALWDTLNAGYEDDMAVMNQDSIYGWYINKGINMIQTDRPNLLLNYLRKINRHQ